MLNLRSKRLRLAIATGIFVVAALKSLDAQAVTSSGSIDQTFGTAGATVISDSGNVILRTLLIQPDDKILVGGGILPASSGTTFIISRFNANGSVDSTFGTSGTVKIEVGRAAYLYALGLQSTGKILAVGMAWASAEPGNYEVVAIRLLSDGSLDRSFGVDGLTRIDVGSSLDYITSLAVLEGDNLMLGGSTGPSRGGPSELLLIKLDPSGALDTAFGRDGVVTSQVGGSDWMSGLTVAGGKITVAGQTYVSDSPDPDDTDLFLGQFKINGRPEMSFGTSGVGKVRTSLGSPHELPMGIIPLGSKYAIAGYTLTDDVSQGFVACYLASGVLDNRFGRGGVMRVDFPGSNETVSSIAATTDGGFLIAGWTNKNGTNDFLLGKYTSRGMPEQRFGVRGFVITDLGPLGNETFTRVATQSTGKIIIAGTTTLTGDRDFVVLRYIP